MTSPTSGRRVVVLLDPAGNALAALPLAPPLVARRAPPGLLIAGTARGADDLRLARSLGARVFEETMTGSSRSRTARRAEFAAPRGGARLRGGPSPLERWIRLERG